VQSTLFFITAQQHFNILSLLEEVVVVTDKERLVVVVVLEVC
jgi:hypothetical protein